MVVPFFFTSKAQGTEPTGEKTKPSITSKQHK